MLGSIMVDNRVPENELWFFSRHPVELISPWGCRSLRAPDAKIANLGLPKSTLDWVIAPH
jgi:hypothetical protein